MNYKIYRLRPGFWVLVNLYNERLYEGHTYAECLKVKNRILGQ